MLLLTIIFEHFLMHYVLQIQIIDNIQGYPKSLQQTAIYLVLLLEMFPK